MGILGTVKEEIDKRLITKILIIRNHQLKVETL